MSRRAVGIRVWAVLRETRPGAKMHRPVAWQRAMECKLKPRQGMMRFPSVRWASSDPDGRPPKSEWSSRIPTQSADPQFEELSRITVDSFDGKDPGSTVRTQYRESVREEHRVEEGAHSKQVSRTHFFHAESVSVNQAEAQPQENVRTQKLAIDSGSVRTYRMQDDNDSTTVARQRGPRQAVRSPSLGMLRPVEPGAQRCVAYCTAEAYDFDRLLKALQKKMVPSIYFSEVIHVCVPDPRTNQEGDVFFFKDGSIVLWDVPEDQSAELFQMVKACQVGPYNSEVVVDKYSEVLDFTYGKQAGLLPSGELVLSIGQDNWAKTQVLEKIAFSHGIQRSVKISVMEHLSEDLISSLKQIPDILMEKRALKIDQKGVMKTMGQLLALRGLINLHLPLSETPEAYWEEPWLEDLYNKISRELDIASRIRTLNRKLDYAHQVVEVLRTELSDRHHTRLELIIIFLISVEVLFEVVHFFV